MLAVLLVDLQMRDQVGFITQPNFQAASQITLCRIYWENGLDCKPHFPTQTSLPLNVNDWNKTGTEAKALPVFDNLVRTYSSLEYQVTNIPFCITDVVRRISVIKWNDFLHHAIYCLILTRGEPYMNNAHFQPPTSTLR